MVREKFDRRHGNDAHKHKIISHAHEKKNYIGFHRGLSVLERFFIFIFLFKQSSV